VDEAGVNLGVMPLSEAMEKAKEQGLDLVEITQTAKPPIVKIIAFDKFRYQKEKEFKKQKLSQKSGELKQIRISARAAKNDLEIQAKKAEGFLAKGNKVEVMLWLRGREKYNKEWAKAKMEEFIKMLSPEHKVSGDAQFKGNKLVIQISKK
jgi:translation initiation factor IF-3